MRVTPTATATAGDDHRFRSRQVRNHQTGLGFFQDGAAGHPNHQIIGIGAALALGAAILTILRRILALIAEVHQRGKVVIGHKNDVTAATAVAAVGTACRHKLFAVKSHGTVAALAGVQPDGRGINKITGCHSIPRAVPGTVCNKNRAGHAGPPVWFFYCLTVQRLRSRPMRSK